MAGEAAFSIVLETLRDLLLEKIKLLSGVSSEVRGLQTLLKETKCFLKDADRRKYESVTIRNWIAELTDLAHRAEDATETYAVEVYSKRGKGFKKLLRRFSSIFSEGLSLHQIGMEISEIKSEIARIKKEMQDSGITESIIQGDSSIANHPDENQEFERQTHSRESYDVCFVGKEEDLKKLVFLVVDDKQHRVISIWGMGGIGKTTIARKVYNHEKTKRSFQCFAWVCVTQKCKIRSVLMEVLRQLTQQKGEVISGLSNPELIEHLCHIQEAKRCMIVLDDLWEVGHWNGLKSAFLVEGSNSKILITTRKQNIAEMGFAYKLGLLNIDEGWQLLKQKAFPHSIIPDGFPNEEKVLEKIGKEMVVKCGYLPLVLSVLGGLLSKKKSMEEWKLVNGNIDAHLYRGSHEEENEIHGVLSLSFDDLPYYLKPCLLYMGLFREDEYIIVEDLYQLWIAQGMISHENRGNDKTLMGIAGVYLRELASRCLLELNRSSATQDQNFFQCTLHDVVRELCLLEGKNNGLGFQVMNYRGGIFTSLLNESLEGTKVRHLAIHFEREIESESDGKTVTHEGTSKRIRSLHFYNCKDEMKIDFQPNIIDFKKFKLLRSLVFERIAFTNRKLPRGITNLILLRYLSFQRCELDELPSSIRNLKYLHTLDLFSSRNVRVPNVLKKMHRLKHLFFPSYYEEEVGQYHLTLDGLEELETLVNFNSLVHDLKSVMKMKNLDGFSAKVHDNESLSTIIDASITKWTKLRRLNIEIKDGCQLTPMEEGSNILKNLFACHSLNFLQISVPIRKLSEECVSQIITSRLVHLLLFDCEFDDDPMEMLGKLPFLRSLVLGKRSFLGEKMKCHVSSFPRLDRLTLSLLPNLREWTVEQGAMTHLSDLEIIRCSCLKMIPDGFKFLVNLQRLEIHGTPELGKRVGEQVGEDFDKVKHVPSIIIM